MIAAARLFERKVSVVVDTLRVDNLRVQFRVKKSLKREPNTLDLTLTNLSERNRDAVQKKYAGVTVSAGYADTVDQVFGGDVRTADSEHEGPDWNTRIQAGDGEAAYLHARVNESFKAGAKVADVLKAVASALGLGLGNLKTTLTGRRLRGGLESFSVGYVAHGRASATMDKLCKAAGLTWSVQNGQLQLLGVGETLPGDVVLLSSDTGLVGTPKLGTPNKKTGKALLKGKSLLQPRLSPGARVEISSTGLKGQAKQFRLLAVEHSGDTAGQDWFTEFEAEPV